MPDYTPNTETVREEYATRDAPSRDDSRRAEFDRWLADVIRKAQAEVWYAGYEAGCEDMENGSNATRNPYTEEA